MLWETQQRGRATRTPPTALVPRHGVDKEEWDGLSSSMPPSTPVYRSASASSSLSFSISCLFVLAIVSLSVSGTASSSRCVPDLSKSADRFWFPRVSVNLAMHPRLEAWLFLLLRALCLKPSPLLSWFFPRSTWSHGPGVGGCIPALGHLPFSIQRSWCGGSREEQSSALRLCPPGRVDAHISVQQSVRHPDGLAAVNRRVHGEIYLRPKLVLHQNPALYEWWWGQMSSTKLF